MSSNILSNFIHQYKLKPEITKTINIAKNKVITNETLKVFQILRPEFEETYIKALKPTLQRIYKYDKVIKFENTVNVYFHTYRILFWIYQYIEILDFYQSDQYKKHSFAKHKSATSKFKRDYKKNKKEAYDKSNAYTGDNKVHAFTLRKYFWHRETIDIYFNATTLFPKNNINYEALKEVEEADTTTMKIIDKIHNYYSSSYTDSEDVIYESLAIVINAYLKLKMGINSKISTSITNELLYMLFNYKVEKTSSDRLANIYISGRINNNPIFKNSKTSEIHSQDDKDKFISLIEEAKKDYSDLENILLDSNQYFISSPLKAFFEQYPMEFLSKVE